MRKKRVYDQDFKNSMVLHKNGKSMSQLCKEYCVGMTALSRWIKAAEIVTLNDGEIVTAAEIKRLQKKNAMLEEENIILKKAIVISMPQEN